MLRPPAFRCVYCLEVYTGNLTIAAIAGHLLHYCKCAPKDRSSDLQVQPGFVESSELKSVNGKMSLGSAFPVNVKRKWPNGHLGAEAQRGGEEPMFDLKADVAGGLEGGTCSGPLKRQGNESMTKGLVGSDDLLQALALDLRKHKCHSHKKKKQFLRDYFHKKPYPSRKEIELLSLLLGVGKMNVASFFRKRRYICMKTIEMYKPTVLLGFDMSELGNVKHRLNFESEPQNSA
ncbi:activity-dependent neuroprotector homeobox protein 2-like [Nannospalax galili]|uniref:activity-dependent neuroprotector homeobox protein 2-like n=1 Tax=Nannospalax galili TaxID=1026970 RepID=UPI0004ED0173|nr:activity-dependent neuroprotector homeobox protein 2-like [Nannospalax galili]